MIKAGMVTLITEEAHGVGTDPEEIRRKVFCTVKSIGQAEVYQAMSLGLNPALKLILSQDFEYKGETMCEYRGKRYRIIRTYMTEADGIELTLQHDAGGTGGAADAG